MDWKNIISNIQDGLGLTQAQIATKAGCGQVTISELFREKTKKPNYEVGAALIDLHKKALRKLKAGAAR